MQRKVGDGLAGKASDGHSTLGLSARRSGYARPGSGILFGFPCFAQGVPSCYHIFPEVESEVLPFATPECRLPWQLEPQLSKQLKKKKKQHFSQARQRTTVPLLKPAGLQRLCLFQELGLYLLSSEGVFTQRTLSRLPMKGLLGTTPARMTLCGRLSHKTLLWTFKVEPDVSCCLHGV